MFARRFDPEQQRKRRFSGSGSGSDDGDGAGVGVGADSVDSDDSSDGHGGNESASDVDVSASESDDEDGSISFGGAEDGSVGVGSRREDSGEESGDVEGPEQEEHSQYMSRHLTIFNKFKSLQPQPAFSVPEIIDYEPIGPIPQPQLPRDPKLHQTISSNLNWLATPTYFSQETTKPFSQFALAPPLKRNLTTEGIHEAFSVQISVLEILLDDMSKQILNPDFRGDLLVNASTGSGKTLAYVLPILHSLHNRVVARIRAIVLVPTKPLVSQVKATFDRLAKGTKLYTMSLKHDVSIADEASKLIANVPDVIVCTPGRLVEHINRNSISLESLRYLVIDEADRLLTQSFQNWCNVVIGKLESDQPQVNLQQKFGVQAQKLVFSATLTTDAGKLSLLKFHKPRLVVINGSTELVNEMFTLPRLLREYIIKFGTAKNNIKPLILAKLLINTGKLSNVLIFTKSNESSIRLCKVLETLFRELNQDISVGYLNSTNNSISSRNQILHQFESGKINILVTTDLMARGVDITSITDVINYDIPNSSREYVHRSGRTARANNGGNVYNLVFGKGEHKWFTKITLEVSRSEEIEQVDAFDVTNEEAVMFKKALASLV